MKKLMTVAVVLVLAAAVWAGSPDWIGQNVPAFKAKDEAGATVDFAQYKGKVVLLNFWASWCMPCLKELPEFDQMAARLAGTDAVVVAISVDTDEASAKRTKAKLGLSNITLLFDKDQTAPKAMQIETMPSTYVIDKNGVVRHFQRGYEHAAVAELEAKVRELLK